MGWRKFDDETGQEIPPNEGFDVQIVLTDKRTLTRNYSSWETIPDGIFTGTIDGQEVIALQVFKVSAINRTPRNREVRDARRNSSV